MYIYIGYICRLIACSTMHLYAYKYETVQNSIRKLIKLCDINKARECKSAKINHTN